jgi:hypothetical protein
MDTAPFICSGIKQQAARRQDPKRIEPREEPSDMEYLEIFQKERFLREIS